MKYAILISLALFAGCDTVRTSSNRLFGGSDQQPEAVAEAAQVEEVQPTEAVAVVSPGWEGAKRTIAGLGDPSRPGRWMETPRAWI